MGDEARGPDRKRDRRIRADIYWRPAGFELFARRHAPADALGGVCIYSDEKVRVGEFLKMEFFLPDAPAVTYTAEVVWIESLGKAGPALYDVGLRFVQLEPDTLALLMRVLGPPGGDSGA